MPPDYWLKIRNCLKNEYGLAIVFVFITATANWLFPYYYASGAADQSFKAGLSVSGGDYGGPVSYDLSTGYQDELQNPSTESGDLSDDFDASLIDNSLILGSSNPLGNETPLRSGVVLYKIKEGDSLSLIASEFGISLNTILWANPQLSLSAALQPGQELIILPVSGVLHRVKDGETPTSISVLYGVSENKLAEFNKDVKYESGEAVVVPGAKPIKEFASRLLPDVSNYFILPAEGKDWGILHNNNAVDIANVRGTPILAAADGLVEEVRTGWNSGYGTYILIKHVYGGLDDLYTLYAHIDRALVSRGDYVLQGAKIGEMGNTGNTHGPTGYHLHFEVHGAQNPFAI